MFSNGFSLDNHSLMGNFFPMGLTHTPFPPHCGPCSFSSLKNDTRSSRAQPETADGKGKWTAQ